MSTAVETVKAAVDDFKAVFAEQFNTIQARMDDFEAKTNRPGAGVTRTQDAGHVKAFVASMRTGRDSGLADFQAAMSSGSDPDGGYAVPSELERSVTELALNACPMEQECEVLTVETPNYTRLVSKLGTTSGWVGETDPRNETGTPQLTALTPFWGEIYANPGMTQTLLDDNAVNLEQFLTTSIAGEFASKENAAFTTGDGVLKPKGLLAYPTAATSDATRAFGTLEHIVTGEAAAFKAASATVSPADCLTDVVYSLKAAYRNGAKWMMNKKTLSVVAKFKDLDGRNIWSPSLVAGQPSLLLGYPVVENEDYPDIAAGAFPITFGNYKAGFCITKRLGLSMLRDSFTNKPYVMFYTRQRKGSMLTNSEAIKVLKISA